MKSRVLFLILALIILLSGSLAFPFVRFRMTSSERKQGATQAFIVGHRGAAGLAPENTLAAFREGMKATSMIELDVHLSKDGHVIVAHDPTADRTTDGTGAWQDLTLEEIKKLDAGSWFNPSFAGERVPTLDEVLSMVDGHCTVIIELKWPEVGVYDGLAQKVVQLIHDKGASHWTVIQSFEISYLTQIVRSWPDVLCYQLIYGTLNFPPIWQDRRLHFGTFAPLKGIAGVVCYYKFTSPGLVDRLHARKLFVGAYTVNEPEDAARLQNLGIDILITDVPDLLSGHATKR